MGGKNALQVPFEVFNNMKYLPVTHMEVRPLPALYLGYSFLMAE